MQKPLTGEYATGYQQYFDLVPPGEFKAVRASTQFLYENLSDAQSKLLCNIVTHPMTARAIGYFLIGHVKHHPNIIEQRYL